jgi:hypothetical protein
VPPLPLDERQERLTWGEGDGKAQPLGGETNLWVGLAGVGDEGKGELPVGFGHLLLDCRVGGPCVRRAGLRGRRERAHAAGREHHRDHQGKAHDENEPPSRCGIQPV